VVILGAAILNASHSFFNVYAVLHWTTLGISTTMASVLWAVAVTSEVALMWKFTHLAKRVSARHCLLAASAACVLRWLVAATEPSFTVLLAIQCLHSMTFGLAFLAVVNFIAKRVEVDHAAQAQSVLTTLVTLSTAIGTSLSGLLYGKIGGLTYVFMALMALIGGLLIASSYRTELRDVAQVSEDTASH